jgi:ubiquinone/menaquinone biosynthesis C-methylase UbiE
VIDERYYARIAGAYLRGIGEGEGDDEALIESALASGIRIHRFKRTWLERVQRVLGMLRGMQPESLLDVGSGRGVFLWPVLDAFPDLDICATDLLDFRCDGLAAVRRGGVLTLSVVRTDAQSLAFRNRSRDIVTALEALEHMPQPDRAVGECLRVARRAVVFSVPSREDANPEHIHLFDRPRLETMFRDAGARQVRIQSVLNHHIGVATR